MSEIVDAITFYSQGIQENLKDVTISDITITKEDDFIRKVIEERINIKKSDRQDKDQIQLILKIIANAISYGIYIEENQESLKKPEEIPIYSVDQFNLKLDKTERQGEYFNPIIAVLLTSSARLILSIAEHITMKNEGYIAYMDTDSIFVKPEIAKEIQEFFRPLNPYNVDTEMFKIETDDNKLPLANVMFYGISAKRYCLYQVVNNEIEILKYSTHGLGHLKDIDGKQVWKDILNHSFKKYNDSIAVSQITISKPSIFKRFSMLNKNKPVNKQIKPFNFMLIGSEINGIIPCLPYTKDTNGLQYRKFIDYRTGLSSDKLPLPSTAYWKSIEDILTQYIRHNDKKFDYIDGIAQRKHITVDRVRYIGKESNNLEESMIIGIDRDSYIEYENLEEFYDWVLTLKPKNVRDKGISRKALRDIKEKIKANKTLNPKTKIVKILINEYKTSIY